ncbi:MAG: recombinase family protein [Chloroflexota bacterium]|nr:recombinase family protein [Chloroflexota bacterium]
MPTTHIPDPTETAMRAIIYSRVSTDAQERDGTSLDTQERACDEVAADRGWSVVRRIREAASGGVLERDGLDELRAALRAGEAEVVVAFAVDRLSRSQNHIGVLFDEFERAGVRLEFVTERFEDTAVGRFILAARAFIAEVEREKIAERTMRGKEERARSGRIPQATGAGCYGYTYNPDSGRREIEPFQATVVRRIFERYAESRSFVAVSSELNDAGIPAFAGGPWYPITVRRTLLNEVYIGRTVYRRTKRVPVRAPGARRRTRVVERPENEHIEIPGATPAIIDDELWSRVQTILNDPERISRRPVPKRRYALRGRLRCGLCNSAMVGQTLSPKGKRYTYYRCRHAYTKSTSRACAARYIPAEALEQEIRDEVRKVLTAPEVVLRELRQPDDSASAREAIERLESELATLNKREERLVRLFGYDEVDGTVVRAELREVQRQREVLSAELETLARPASAVAAGVDEDGLRQVCATIAARLDGAEPEQYERVMEAVQLSVAATRDEVTVEGLLPTEPPEATKSPERPPECADSDENLSPLNKHRHHHVHVAVFLGRAEDALA